MSWRKKATDELTDDDELLMIQQFVFYMEELIKLLRQPNPNIEEIINHVIDKNNFINHYIYIHISRGVDENRNHIYTTECVPYNFGYGRKL